MATLSSSIVKNQVATMRDVEEALARQVLYGGDLATNLLELAAVSEAELTRLLAESHGLDPAPVGPLPEAREQTLHLVPGDLALRHGFYPLREEGGTLTVAVSEPLPSEVEADLAFSLGVVLRQQAAPQVRIRQAISRDYAMPMDRRTLRLVAKLEGRPDPSPSSMPAASRASLSVPHLPRPASVPPIPYSAPKPAPEHAGVGAGAEQGAERQALGASQSTGGALEPGRSPGGGGGSNLDLPALALTRSQRGSSPAPPRTQATPRALHRGDGGRRPDGGRVAGRCPGRLLRFRVAIFRVFRTVCRALGPGRRPGRGRAGRRHHQDSGDRRSPGPPKQLWQPCATRRPSVLPR